jgi:hypothetical protein
VHTANLTSEKTEQFDWEVLPCPYSLDLVPAAYYLFDHLIGHMRGKHNKNDETVQQTTQPAGPILQTLQLEAGSSSQGSSSTILKHWKCVSIYKTVCLYRIVSTMCCVSHYIDLTWGWFFSTIRLDYKNTVRILETINIAQIQLVTAYLQAIKKKTSLWQYMSVIIGKGSYFNPSKEIIQQ